jgi:hypothetical protein
MLFRLCEFRQNLWDMNHGCRVLAIMIDLAIIATGAIMVYAFLSGMDHLWDYLYYLENERLHAVGLY